ncbi:MAG: putative ABC transporter ATP-binding protein YknY [Verrucomicrobiae bacterium]|nr:putative ABC transporter ATP-binding protein YknY [Verrucomicrobiae bacterium]
MSRSTTIIRTRAVTKHYRKGEVVTQALRGVTCEIRRGEFISVMGPSGSGKSTFFNVIGALSTPTAGRVLIDEVDVAQLSNDELAYVRCKKIGYVFQSYNLVTAMTALENVMTPMLFAGVIPDEARTRGMKLLGRVGLAEKWFHQPKQLSGGQQQRVAIARALANRPRILLCDELTANLDLQTGEAIIQLLVELNKQDGVTIICATHDYRMLDKSDRIFWIRDGVIDRIENRADLKISTGTIGGL